MTKTEDVNNKGNNDKRLKTLQNGSQLTKYIIYDH